MNCEQSRQILLAAELSQLRAALAEEPVDEFAQHVNGCASCRSNVLAILRAQAELSGALDTLSEHARGPSTLAPAHAQRRQLRAWRIAIPTALAASLALFALLRNRQPATPIAPQRTADFSQTVQVNVTGNRNVTIFETANPKITVIWYY